MNTTEYWTAVSTSLGSLSIAWRGDRITKLQFDTPPPAKHESATPPSKVAAAIKKIVAYTQDGNIDLSGIDIDLDHMTPFGRRVLEAARQIQSGSTLTYSELARKIEKPLAARAVGTALGRNPILLIVPCHRVVGVSGLGGFSAPAGLDLKRRLLRLEKSQTCGSVSSLIS